MRRPSLRAVFVGFFGLLSGLLVVAGGVSTCGCYGVAWEPHANAENSVLVIRGRLRIAVVEGGAGIGAGFLRVWLGAPRKKTDVLGAFHYQGYEMPPTFWAVDIDIPIPFLAAVAATIAYVIYRRFRLTLVAWLSMFVIASIFLAAYAHPYEREHYPSMPADEPSESDSDWEPDEQSP